MLYLWTDTHNTAYNLYIMIVGMNSRIYFDLISFAFCMIWFILKLTYHTDTRTRWLLLQLLACKVSRWNGKCSQTRLATFIRFQSVNKTSCNWHHARSCYGYHTIQTVTVSYRITFDNVVLSSWKTLQKYAYKYLRI